MKTVLCVVKHVIYYSIQVRITDVNNNNYYFNYSSENYFSVNDSSVADENHRIPRGPLLNRKSTTEI